MVRFRKKEIKYLAVILFLIVLSVISRIETLPQVSNKTFHASQNSQIGNIVNCDDVSDTIISALVSQPEPGNSCLNIGCGSFF